MEFLGKVGLRELEKKPFETAANQTDKWVQNVLERSAPDAGLTGLDPKSWAAGAELRTRVRVEKIGTEYLATGELKGRVKSPCSRCGDLFGAERKTDFRVVLARMAKGEKARDEDSGDADYIYFEGDDINLVEILSEQMIVLEPVAECPAQKEGGDCILCGLNPQYVLPEDSKSNKSAGQELENSAFSAFSKLADLKGFKKSLK